MDSEQNVGSINYELKIRKPKQIFLVFFSHVKAKLRDLVKLKPKEEFKKYYKISVDVTKIIDLWKTTQIKLDKNKLSSKEAIQVQIDQRINRDLQYINYMVVNLLHHKRWIIFSIKLELVWAQSKKFFIIMSDIVEILACHFPKVVSCFA